MLVAVACLVSVFAAVGQSWKSWVKKPSCGAGMCWCDGPIAGVEPTMIQYKEPISPDGCSFPIGPGNAHCCDAHDKCYRTAGVRKFHCEENFCNCLSWYNKWVCIPLNDHGKFYEAYYNGQREFVRCQYRPRRDQYWYFEQLERQGRRRLAAGAEKARGPAGDFLDLAAAVLEDGATVDEAAGDDSDAEEVIELPDGVVDMWVSAGYVDQIGSEVDGAEVAEAGLH